jgi:hypothetical protein
MGIAARVKRMLFGTGDRIAGAVYGTVVVMGVIAAGSGASAEPLQLGGFAAATVLVLWIAHVHAHAMAESIQLARRVDRAELASVARRELAIPLAAVPSLAVLVLGGLGVVQESRAIRLALGVGVAMLVVQGVRFARLEHTGRMGAVIAVSMNVLIGLVIVALEVLLTH